MFVHFHKPPFFKKFYKLNMKKDKGVAVGKNNQWSIGIIAD